MILKKSIIILLCFIGTLAQAQQVDPPVAPIEPAATDYAYKNKSAVALSVGTTGFGFEYAYNFHQNFNARARASMFSVNDYTTGIEFSGQPVQVVGNIDVMNIDLLVEYLPFKKSSFKLVGGASYFIDGGGAVQIIYDGDLQYGDMTISKEEVGTLTIGLDYSGIAPYMGLGIGRAVPKKRVGFGFELGTYYAGSPDVSLSATEMFAPTATEEEQQLKDNLSSYSWLPYITLRLAVRI